MKKSWKARIDDFSATPKPAVSETPNPVTIHEVIVSGITKSDIVACPFSSTLTESQIQVSGKFFRVLISASEDEPPGPYKNGKLGIIKTLSSNITISSDIAATWKSPPGAISAITVSL